MAGKSVNEMPDSKSQLTPKQKRFVEEYLIDLNATQAIRGGYSKKRADQIACENLRKPEIQKAVQKAMAERSQRTEITQDRVLRELAVLGFSNLEDFVEWGPDGIRIKDANELSPEQRACVAEVSETVTKQGRTVRFKLHNKTSALEMIGRHLKMFTDKLRLGGDQDAPPIQHQSRYTNFPPEPKTLAEWEKQVAEAEAERKKRKEEAESN